MAKSKQSGGQAHGEVSNRFDLCTGIHRVWVQFCDPHSEEPERLYLQIRAGRQCLRLRQCVQSRHSAVMRRLLIVVACFSFISGTAYYSLPEFISEQYKLAMNRNVPRGGVSRKYFSTDEDYEAYCFYGGAIDTATPNNDYCQIFRPKAR